MNISALKKGFEEALLFPPLPISEMQQEGPIFEAE